MEMLTQVASVEVTPAATVLESALLECDEIKRLAPPYNVQLRESERSAWFVSRSLDDAVEHSDRAHAIGPLPSRYALSGLAAVRALLCGREADSELRARAVEAPVWLAPDAGVFDEAWRALSAEHFATERSSSPDAILSRAARVLVPEEGESELAPDEWDVPRVRRHLDRAIVRGVHLVRRGRLLVLLADSAVMFRERLQDPWRCIAIEGAEVISCTDLESPHAPPRPQATRGRRERLSLFNGPRYDRLRVLATELTRVFRESGDVRVCSNNRVLERAALLRLL
jgi:hypothetical protein